LQGPEARQNVSRSRQAPVSGPALNDRLEGSAETSSWIGSVGLPGLRVPASTRPWTAVHGWGCFAPPGLSLLHAQDTPG
ncbi:MAG: hypothetical protein KDA80_08830, partial [Planctomycetaceae bacterium]|nr:hypothetical protein [Planctomycetaceae bacterium]